jgi:hypothetical protein
VQSSIAEPIAGVFELFGSGFDHLMTGERWQNVCHGGEGSNIGTSEQHEDGGGESDRTTGGTAYESDLVIVLSHVERSPGLAKDFLLECEVHGGLPD